MNKTYFAWARPKNGNRYCQTYLNAKNMKEAKIKFAKDYDLDGKVSLARNQ